ncbi:MAG: transcriptional regulator [Polyangiaceae bacterium]|nr:transcriptional regulator [Polyangiaceae bacterium]
MLTLVRPAPAGQEGGDPPARRPRSPALRLTDVEAMRLRAALRNLRALYGSWSCLADVMGLSEKSLKHIVAGRRASPATALLVARAAGATLTRVIGAPTAADRCPTCGACRGGDR